MAGASIPGRSPWPMGDVSYMPIMLGPTSIITDTTGYKKAAFFKAPFDFNVKKAYLMMLEGAQSGAACLMKILDDSSSVQTIVAERAIDGSDDAGTLMTLTIADEGPILTNGVLELHIDSGPTPVLSELAVQLWIQPVFR